MCTCKPCSFSHPGMQAAFMYEWQRHTGETLKAEKSLWHQSWGDHLGSEAEAAEEKATSRVYNKGLNISSCFSFRNVQEWQTCLTAHLKSHSGACKVFFKACDICVSQLQRTFTATSAVSRLFVHFTLLPVVSCVWLVKSSHYRITFNIRLKRLTPQHDSRCVMSLSNLRLQRCILSVLALLSASDM